MIWRRRRSREEENPEEREFDIAQPYLYSDDEIHPENWLAEAFADLDRDAAERDQPEDDAAEQIVAPLLGDHLHTEATDGPDEVDEEASDGDVEVPGDPEPGDPEPGDPEPVDDDAPSPGGPVEAEAEAPDRGREPRPDKAKMDPLVRPNGPAPTPRPPRAQRPVTDERRAATTPELTRAPAADLTGTRPPEDPDLFRGYPRQEVIDDFRLACTSRAIDDRQIAMQKQSRVFFQISGAGHEALGVALARHLRPGYDWSFPYYRDQALVLGLGVSPLDILLQAVGSVDDPSSAGRQMPAHWGSRERNIVTQSSPTGSQCIPAVGCAEAGRYLVRRPHLSDLPGTSMAHPDEITYVSLGEGACSQGEFWESLNTATNLSLPVLYVVPDNGFAISVPSTDQHPAPVHELVSGFRGLMVRHIDGTDYFTARDTVRSVIAHLRAGAGPVLIHADVVRPYSHSAADSQSKYRSVEELAADAARDPLDRFEESLVSGGVLTPVEAAAIRAEAGQLVADAASSAMSAPRPDPANVTEHLLALPERLRPVEPEAGEETGEPVLMGDSIRAALHEALAADERIRVFGEDVADAREQVLAGVEGKGGVFGTTHGLQRRFGQARCFNTPLSEANIVGRAVGHGLRGLRPAPEVQFFDYIWPAMTQLRSEAATIRWRSAGSFSCPMVLRVPVGGYLTGGSIWHSQSGESIFAHIPGLAIAMPSRARDAVGLLRYAFQCEDPILFLEHKHLLRQPYAADPYPDPDWVLPFGVGAIRRPGDDLTVITWGATVEKSLVAARELADTDGIEAEVIDLRTISPWDRELVAESIARTSRALVVHEDTLTAGFGAEVAAWIAEHCFDHLDAPVRRVGALDTPVGYEPQLERAILPQTETIRSAISDLAAW